MTTVPLSGTNIRILSGIPFNSDYKNSRWFTDISSQLSYFNSKPRVHTMSEANFQRIDGFNFIAVNKSSDELWNANYIMFQNAHYNNKWFYAFVTKIEYKQRNNTHLHFEIDVLQTWRFEMNFKPSYVVREHRPLWNSDGTPVVNTVDEGLAYGLEYDNVLTTRVRPSLGGYKWFVIVTKTPLEAKEDNDIEPSIIGTPQPLCYYVVPFKDNGNTPNIRTSGANSIGLTQLISPTKGQGLLDVLYSNEKAVNNIVSLYVTEYIGIDVEFEGSASEANDILIIKNTGGLEYDAVAIPDSSAVILKIKELQRFHEQEIHVNNDKYIGYKNVTESKLLMYPYTQLIFDDFRGNRVDFKTEFIDNKELKVLLKGSLGLSNMVTYGIVDYNNADETYDNARSNESALINNSPNDVPIINDYLAAFLQGNRNSIETQKSSAVWNGVMGAVSSAVGAGASASVGNPVGAIAGATDVVKGAGNSVLQMQAINSKLQDIDNVPPQITKMGSNTAYDFGNNYNGLYIIRKQIKPEYRKILTDFFNMFGYKTNEVKIPNFRTRQNWNYVQTLNCNILGNFANDDIEELKQIFDNGITLWHSDDIGNYELPNGVR